MHADQIHVYQQETNKRNFFALFIHFSLFISITTLMKLKKKSTETTYLFNANWLIISMLNILSTEPNYHSASNNSCRCFQLACHAEAYHQYKQDKRYFLHFALKQTHKITYLPITHPHKSKLRMSHTTPYSLGWQSATREPKSKLIKCRTHRKQPKCVRTCDTHTT